MIASGSSQSSCSAISSARVFLPSIRYGSRSVETSKAPCSAAKARAALPQSPMCPSESSRVAPSRRICYRILWGVVCGANTNVGMAARRPYALSATPALPAVGAVSLEASPPRARVTAHDIPRALNEPVGLTASSLIHTRWRPKSRATRGSGRSGVIPSPRVTGSSSSPTGSHSRYRHIDQDRVARSAFTLGAGGWL